MVSPAIAFDSSPAGTRALAGSVVLALSAADMLLVTRSVQYSVAGEFSAVLFFFFLKRLKKEKIGLALFAKRSDLVGLPEPQFFCFFLPLINRYLVCLARIPSNKDFQDPDAH